MLTHKGTTELITKRLKLRKFQLSDAESMFENYAADERVTRFLNWEPYQTSQEVETFLQSTMEEYTNKHVYHWAMEYKYQVIGSISVTMVDEQNCSCEVGYCMSYDYWNQGIMSEAFKAVMKFLFLEVKVHRVIAKHDVENPASGKVMQKCGMTLEGRLREHYYRADGSFSDALLYGILRSEF